MKRDSGRTSAYRKTGALLRRYRERCEREMNGYCEGGFHGTLIAMKHFLFAVIFFFATIGFVFTAVWIGMQVGAFNVRGSSLERNAFFGALPASETCDSTAAACPWNETPEWATVAGGLEKDADIIARVSGETDVPARMIAAVVVPEQLRFFTSSREVFKSYFEPLKILGSLSQFSLGVSGIKQETADAIETYAASTTSPFYPGPGMAALLAYSPDEGAHETALYNRLTDPKNHYYSYLYTAVYIKEAEKQWEREGYDIHENAGIVTTLFNIGFANSHPNNAPHIGGADISVGGVNYSFGQLGANFYASNELFTEFSR